MSSLAIAAAALDAGGKLLDGVFAQRAQNARKKALRAQADQIRLETSMDAQSEYQSAQRASAAGVVRAAASGGMGQSALDVLADFDATSLFNQRAAIYRGNTRAANSLREAEAARQEGNFAMLRATFEAGGSLLGSYGQARKARAQMGAGARGGQ